MDFDDIVKKMSFEEKVRLCTGQNNWQTKEMKELGIPPLLMSDGTNGVRFQKNSTDETPDKNLYNALVNFSFDSQHALEKTYPATCFPSGAALACSWDVTLAEEIGAAVAQECKQLGIGLLLGPGMNIRRHPLTARNFEYYSEDPVLSADIAAGMVCGVQGQGVGATLKHFICNNSDTRRTKLNCIVEERALREIYLAGFERAIKKAKPAAVMGSYPAVNGEQCCESQRLLTDILRGEWGFEGITLSDWGGVKNSAKAAAAGLDLQMPHSNQYIEQVTEALNAGNLDEATLNRNCKRLLKLIFTYSRSGKPQPKVNWQSQHALAQKAAAQCAVLLKNQNNMLPLDPQKAVKIAVLGRAALEPVFQGTGCAVVKAKQVDVPLDELCKALPKAQIDYCHGYLGNYETEDTLLFEAANAAKQAEIAIVFVASRLPGESDEYDRPSMDLESGHLKLIDEVCKVQKNTLVVVCSGDAVAMPWALKPRAILEMWYSGQGSGLALAQIISGQVSPCGKLAISWPNALDETSAYLDFPHQQDMALYREGVFVGYRWYNARNIQPLFPFGFGLSYTSFEYKNLKLTQNGNDFTAEFVLANTGKMAGAEVAQLYVAPAPCCVLRPPQELKAFAKVWLKAGEQKTVTLHITRKDFAYYDVQQNNFCISPGLHRVLVGGASNNLPLSQSVLLQADGKKAPKLTADSHYSDVFENPKNAKIYFDFLVEHGLLEKGQVSPHLVDELKKTFWGLFQHLDMLTAEKLPQKQLQLLLARLNGE